MEALVYFWFALMVFTGLLIAGGLGIVIASLRDGLGCPESGQMFYCKNLKGHLEK